MSNVAIRCFRHNILKYLPKWWHYSNSEEYKLQLPFSSILSSNDTSSKWLTGSKMHTHAPSLLLDRETWERGLPSMTLSSCENTSKQIFGLLCWWSAQCFSGRNILTLFLSSLFFFLGILVLYIWPKSTFMPILLFLALSVRQVVIKAGFKQRLFFCPRFCVFGLEKQNCRELLIYEHLVFHSVKSSKIIMM